MTYHVLPLIKDIAQQIASLYPDPLEQQQTALWMLQAITHKTEAEILAHEDITLNEQQTELLKHWIYQQVNKHMPLQYLLGSTPFDDVDIMVEPPILIPRPETEEWCIKLREKLMPLREQKLMILDLCTGTGCIAVTLGKALPNAEVYATDILDQAVALTKKNALHNRVINIHAIKSDLYTALPAKIKFDLIVANPPYISPQEWEQLDPMVTEWEDQRALVAEDNGLALIKQIIHQAPIYLKSNKAFEQHHIPQLVIEIGYTQGPRVKKLMEDSGFKLVCIEKDLEGKDRVVAGFQLE